MIAVVVVTGIFCFVVGMISGYKFCQWSYDIEE